MIRVYRDCNVMGVCFVDGDFCCPGNVTRLSRFHFSYISIGRREEKKKFLRISHLVFGLPHFVSTKVNIYIAREDQREEGR